MRFEYTRPVRSLGAAATQFVVDVASTCRVAVLIAGSLRRKSWAAHGTVARETLRQIARIGLRALVPSLLLGVLVGMTVFLAASSALQVLADLTDPLVLWRKMGILLVLEIGPFVPAIIVAGWCGGVVTADLAEMNAAGELADLEACGVGCMHRAVLPRALALFVSTLALAVCFVLAVLGACGLSAWLFGDLPVALFLDSALADVTGTDLALFAGKSAAFGVVVTSVAVLRGLTSGSARGEVAASVSLANAHSLAGILVVDAVFAVAAYA